LIRQLFKQAGIRQCFTAEYRCNRGKLSQGMQLIGLPDTGVNPQIQIREGLMQLLQYNGLNGAALDGVEIGNIKMGEAMQPEQSPYHIKGFTAVAQDALQWQVGFTGTASGMNSLAAGEIDNGNQVHG